MPTAQQAKRAREALDRRLGPLGPPSKYAVPQRGWIRAVRDALRMPASELAVRMGISGASVRSLEENEMTGGIRLSSLRRAAEAMECTLVYAFLPNESLEGVVRTRAREVLDEHLGRVHQTMVLEGQETDMLPSAVEDRLQAIMDSPKLWSRRRSDK